MTSCQEELDASKIMRPDMGKDDAINLVQKLFGLTVTDIKELNSYDDRNFRIQVEGECKNPHITNVCQDGYVLKVTNSQDSRNPAIVEAQTEMMLFLQSKGFNVPKPEKNKTGTYSINSKVNGDQAGDVSGENIVRLLTFIPGKILYHVNYTAQIFRELGEFIGKMDTELESFHNEALKQRKFLWCMESVPLLSQYIFSVDDEDKRKLVKEVLQAWQDNVVPLIPELEKGYIHGDVNEQNIIVNTTDTDPSIYHIDGLIDFGDIQYSCLLFELAVSIMYMMVEVKVMDPNEVAGHILGGYLKHRTVSEDQWKILKECIAGRFAQSLVLSAYSILKDPGNQYLLVTQARGWNILDTFWKTDKDELIAQWKQTLKIYC